ncbi:DUF3632 domain-containing protein [Aspergillus clavatus NRRL 1]|uniref:Uncharacterized protein n=1 Tax=Aspergillus clavatus (strain ATCC 1007 / CBS 513.65 / DSM 816 / NCTC 3887 / NRRL 1 / QM 1276 / 107) TaxID=344612 RepID=A1C8R4_ASPCL|nr:uncharacterized protein ACLA_044210 [Aspergillus clavatus NRRL 1]EAW13701.1 hypothetical protein ACLA_044210 [Aspergillus clavatus NRRL 1]
MDKQITKSQDSCLAYLDEQISSADENTLNLKLAVLLRSFLTTEDGKITEEIACQIDAYEVDTKTSSDPLAQYDVRTELGEYISILYQLIFTVAQLIPYNDTRQDRIVQLLKDSKASENESDFAELMAETWNECYRDEHELGVDSPELQERCEVWVNFSAFLSRCVKAGLNEYPGGFKYPGLGIHDALDSHGPSTIVWDSRVIVAAQYLVMNGSRIREELFKENEKKGNCKLIGEELWHRWTKRFMEISDQAQHTPEISSAVNEAYNIMKGLDTLVSDAVEEEKVDLSTDDRAQLDEEERVKEVNNEVH